MNLKTTLVLAVVALAGAGVWAAVALLQPARPTSETIAFLETGLTPDRVTAIEVAHGDRRLVLERGAGDEWTLPGRWPTRRPAVEELVGTVTSLRSRFAPMLLAGDAADLKQYGLDPSQQPVTVTVKAVGDEHKLLLGEEPGDTNRFSKPTYLRLDDKGEVVRLRPNLLTDLDRPVAYYQQHQLFPAERVTAADGQAPAERLAAQAVAAKGPGVDFTMTRSGADWVLTAPVKDRVDPDKLKGLLAAVPDVWAEDFVDKPKAELAEYGLKQPEQTLRVTRPNGATVTLLIGKVSNVKTRKTTRPGPAPFPGAPEQPQEQVIHEEYRYAKLQDNAQVFEIKSDKLKDVFVAADALRDPRLSRFKPEDARRLEIVSGGHAIVLAKPNEVWKLQKPTEADAEASKVTDLLDKLSNLQARDKDVIDTADPKAYGLAPPAGRVTVDTEESVGEGDAKKKVPHKYVFDLGKDDKEKGKLYVRVEGWPRVNAVEESVAGLVSRPALAYRNRRVLDFGSFDLARVEVKHGSESFALEQDKSEWRLAAPVKAEADATKANKLADDLGRLEAVEYVSDAPKPAELEQFGLARPAARATVTFTADAKKPARTLLLGKQRGDKPEYYAKLEGAPAVFVVKKDIHDDLGLGMLAYRPLQVWQVKPEDVVEVRHQTQHDAYRLRREGSGWHIVEPFEAPAVADQVQPLLTELAGLKAERYESNVARELAPYGLDKPYLRLVLATASRPDAEKAGDKAAANKPTPAKEHVLLVGKPTAAGAKSRFAKLGDGEAVFVLGDKVTEAADRGALDLLDRHLLSLSTKDVTSVQSTGPDGWTLRRDKDRWHVDASVAKFNADTGAVADLLGAWSDLRAEKFAAYGPKADAALYGLGKPARTLTLTLQPTPGAKPAAPVRHTLALGKPVPGEPGAVYARLDNGPGTAVLPPATAAALQGSYLAFVNHGVLHFDQAAAAALGRRMHNEDLEVVKQGDAWRLTRPAAAAADATVLTQLLDDLANLRAVRVAAYPVTDLKPFGLDQPEAVVTVRLAGSAGKAARHVLRIGKPAPAGPGGHGAAGERFAIADGSQAVAVIAADLAERLLAPPLQFRDRTLARAADIDRALLERGPRKAVFAKVEGAWKMTSPTDAEAETTDLEDFLRALGRLRADRLVADRPADLKPYGLDRPTARWRFESGDKEVLGLLVGAAEKPGPEARHYAKLATGDLVFLLDARLSAQALGEYRYRSVWSSLDAAQIDAVRFTDPRHPFALEKIDNVWHLAGQPDVKVKAEAVTETLDALSRLKVERFVVDKGADFKLFGLEPPELAIEIQTSSGKKQLDVGRREGASQRRYARVPEGNRTDVFLISEADAAKIARPQAAFVQPAKTARAH